jgi:hypothetical protein
MSARSQSYGNGASGRKRIPFKKDIATGEHDDIGSRLSQEAGKHR